MPACSDLLALNDSPRSKLREITFQVSLKEINWYIGSYCPCQQIPTGYFMGWGCGDYDYYATTFFDKVGEYIECKYDTGKCVKEEPPVGKECPASNDPGVYLYEDPRYGGQCIFFDEGIGIPDMSKTKIGDENLESLRVVPPPGQSWWDVRLYRDKDLGLSRPCLSTRISISDLSTYDCGANTISSLTIWKLSPPTLPWGPTLAPTVPPPTKRPFTDR